MFALVRNVLLFALVSEHDWPGQIANYKFPHFFIVWTADSAGLFAYPKCQNWQEARDAWASVVSCGGRPLSEKLAFPQGFVGDHSLYLSVLHGIIGPVRWRIRDDLEYARGEYRDRLARYYELVSLHYRVYDLLDDLGRDSVPLWQQRIKLGELYEILGPEMYHAGQIPQPLP